MSRTITICLHQMLLFETSFWVLLFTFSPCYSVQRGSAVNTGSETFLSSSNRVAINLWSHHQDNSSKRERDLHECIKTHADRKHPGTIKWTGRDEEEDEIGNRLLGRLTRLHPQAPLEFVHGSSTPEPRVTITFRHNSIPSVNIMSASNATAQPPDVCTAELGAVNQCLSSMSTGEAEACVDCFSSVTDALPDGEMSCTLYEDEMCSGIDTCGCTACQSELEVLSSCAVNYDCGFLECPGTATPSTPKPTECSAEFDAANQCLSTYSNSSCVDCMNSILEGLPDAAMTCTFFKEQICAGISMCGCTACQDELEESSSCSASYACGLLDCTATAPPSTLTPEPTAPSTTPEPTDVCIAESETANLCISSLSTGEACANCINNVFEGLPDGEMTCRFFKEQICSGISTCGCTACQDELEESSSCIVNYDCGLLGCTYTARPTTPEPTEICQEEVSAFRACTSTMESCSSCVDAAMDALFQDGGSPSCEEYNVGICSVFASDCDCGTCRDYLEDYFSCIVTQQDCEPLHCNIDKPVAPVDSKSTGGIPAAAVGGVIGAVLIVGVAVGAILVIRWKRSNKDGHSKVEIRVEKPADSYSHDMHPKMSYSLETLRQEQVHNDNSPRTTCNSTDIEIRYPAHNSRQIAAVGGHPYQDYVTTSNSFRQHAHGEEIFPSFKNQCRTVMDVPMAVAVLPGSNSSRKSLDP